jgi:hypothetical protein
MTREFRFLCLPILVPTSGTLDTNLVFGTLICSQGSIDGTLNRNDPN